MKRAILVSSGTLAGLAAVLTYSGADVVPAIAAGPVDSSALGAPPPIGAGDPSSTPTPDASSAAPAPTASAAAPAASAKPTVAAKPAAGAAAAKPAVKPAATPAATTAAKPVTAPVAKPVVAPKPTPKPTPVATGPKDFVGSSYTHKYGTIQVGIRVQNGKIIAVWPVVFPNGPSQPYSDFSIPVLKSETMKAQSASIANVSGATLTWQGWKISLSAAMHKAGL
jgi:uncharacterized protein with FMN-binding domain